MKILKNTFCHASKYTTPLSQLLRQVVKKFWEKLKMAGEGAVSIAHHQQPIGVNINVDVDAFRIPF